MIGNTGVRITTSHFVHAAEPPFEQEKKKVEMSPSLDRLMPISGLIWIIQPMLLGGEFRGCQSTLIRGYRQENTIRPMEITMA
jgi:hypothetical protein